MATFAQWLADQKDRQDAVGWFSRYWADLSPKPRLSSPSSIGTHLEDRDQGGFRAELIGWPDDETRFTGTQLREAYDQVLHEYRQVRAQVVAAAQGIRAAPAGDGQQALPGMEAVPGGPGEAVERARQAGLAAARAARPAETQWRAGGPETQLDRIEARLDAIAGYLGLELGIRPDQISQLDWAGWFAVADLNAEADAQ
jgi:hypothetical protein